METLELLKNLTRINSASGNESNICEYISAQIKDYCDDLYRDAIGNLIAHKKGSGKKIMFAAHMDEIGIIVTAIDKNGFIRFSSIGGLNTKDLVYTRVVFPNGTVGVVAAEEALFKDKPSLSKLYIDIGAADKQEAEKKVCVGDIAAFTGEFVQCGTRVVSKALDNRAGCAVLIRAMSEITSSDNDLYFVFTAQEEVGLRGAKTSAFAIEPDISVAVDVTDTGDTPKAPVMEVKLGKGAAVKVMDRSIICDADIRSKMVETAKKHNISYQMEIMTDGGTDAGAIHLSRSGVKTGGISVPVRYVHSPSEMADINDIEACIALVSHIACDW